MSQNDGPTSDCAVLGEKRKDVPLIPLPEHAVVYSTVKSSAGSRGNMAEDIHV